MKGHLRSIVNYKPGKPVEEVKRELGLVRVYKLASNELPFPPSPSVKKAISRAVRDISRYPESSVFYLREEISKRHNIAPENIIFGNGSDEIIIFAVRALLDEGDEAVTATPTFLIYRIACLVENRKITEIPMKEHRYDLDGILEAINEKTRLVFIVNPDNPNGTYIKRQELVAFLEKVPQAVYVFLDEAYYEFAVDAEDYPDGRRLLDRFPNLIVSRTFSKYYGLAGLRIGYAFASRGIIEVLEKVKEPFNVNSVAQAAALAALNDEAYYRDKKEQILAGRRYLEEELSNMGLSFVPSITNFILIDTGTDSKALADALLKDGIIVRELSGWGLPGYIRVTVGQAKENRRFIWRLWRWRGGVKK